MRPRSGLRKPAYRQPVLMLKSYSHTCSASVAVGYSPTLSTRLTRPSPTKFTELIARRVKHEPVAYLVGRKEFYGIELQVDRRVLIPRPETEMLVDAVLVITANQTPEPVTVADVGTGSGAIALAVAANAENARIYALDVSKDALAVAAANMERLDASSRVTLLHGDLLEALPYPVDVIVATSRMSRALTIARWTPMSGSTNPAGARSRSAGLERHRPSVAPGSVSPLPWWHRDPGDRLQPGPGRTRLGGEYPAAGAAGGRAQRLPGP